MARRTRERELILDRIPRLPGHFGAEELWHTLAREGQHVARATVYRTLELLVDRGVLQRVQLDEGGARYELLQGRAPHAHLFCLGCAGLFDYHLPMLARLPQQVKQSRGFRAEHLLVRVCGYCRKCSRVAHSASNRQPAARRKRRVH